MERSYPQFGPAPRSRLSEPQRPEPKRAAVLGLSFKPYTDDMREAVSIEIISVFLKEGATIIAYDPAAKKEAKRIFSDRIQLASNPVDCLRGSDLAVLVTEWNEFKKLRPGDFLRLMRNPVVYDGRRIYDPAEMRNAGINFGAIGLSPA